MKINHVILIFLTSLISCTWESDGTLPNGYPFEGGIHDLNFRVFDNTKFGYNSRQNSHAWYYLWHDSIVIIGRKELCDSVTRLDCGPCNCDEVDFKTEILVNKKDAIYHVWEAGFDPRVLIDHDARKILVQTTRHSKSGSSGRGSYYRDFYYDEWLIIPKPPLGYTLNLDY